MLRAEWEELQKGTAAQLRTSYEEYLQRLGLKSEAEAIAQRAKEEVEGTVFGTHQKAINSGVFGTATRADRKISDEEEAANQAAQLSNDSYAAKQILALTGGRITGKEPVYVLGTPEHAAYMKEQMDQQRATGKPAQAPDAYLDAQAFNARFIEYSRLGGTDPTYLDYDATTNQFSRKPNPYFNAKVLEPTVGLGYQWQALQQQLFAAPAGPKRDAVQYEIDSLFTKSAGGDPVGQRFFMRTPGDITGNGGAVAGTTDKTILNTTQDPNGNTITKYSDGSSTSTNSAGLVTQLTGGTSGNPMEDTVAATKKAERVSAYNTLYDEFNKYGLSSLVSDIKNYLIDNAFDPSEFSIKLQNTTAYQNRFSANKDRIKAGLGALSPAAYIALEDQYQNVMRNYGLPSTYWKQTVDPVTGVTSQQGFNKLIASDVDSIELEDRIATAQQRVVNANPEVLRALKEFYPDIQNGDILAYVLDPTNAKDAIKRKVTNAEIGGAAIQADLKTGLARADELRAAGITKESAQQGFGNIAGGLQRCSQLAAIYGEDPYSQATAETEVFKLAGAQEARKQRQKITGLEQATFGGKTGLSSGALVRDRAGTY
jgi:hypothetical protein